MLRVIRLIKRVISVIKSKLQIYSAKIILTGVNLGSGKGWHRYFWTGVDQLDGNKLSSETTLPFSNASVSNVYSSHFFEHVDDATAEKMFMEAFRILKKKGVFRIVVPDFEKIHAELNAQNMQYFESTGFTGRKEWHAYGVEKNVENVALHWFANYQNTSYENSENVGKKEGFYRGPPVVDSMVVREKAEKLDTLEFGQWAVSMVPEEYRDNGGHINTWTYSKFENLLTRIGFQVKKSSVGESVSSAMSKFDYQPNREILSIYIEAYKG